MLSLRLSAVLALIAWPLSAQRVLQPFKEIPAPGIANAVSMGSTRCDSHGDIYIRIASAPDLTVQLLTRIGRDGSIATFNPEKVTDPALQGWLFLDFAVTGDAVWLLAARRSDGSYILRFSLQGDYKGVLKLEADFYPEQFAVFDAGDFLISGTERKGRGANEQFRAVTAMFDKHGKFLKRIELDEEVKPGEKTPASAQPYLEVSSPITLGTAESYGGEIYVLRATASPVLFVISSAGTLARRFVLEPPSPDSRIGAMRVAQGQIAVEFVKPAPGAKQSGAEGPVLYAFSGSVYVVYDAFHGDKLADYTRAPGLLGSFACFDGRGGFDFLGEAESGTRKIIRASAN